MAKIAVLISTNVLFFEQKFIKINSLAIELRCSDSSEQVCHIAPKAICCT